MKKTGPGDSRIDLGLPVGFCCPFLDPNTPCCAKYNERAELTGIYALPSVCRLQTYTSMAGRDLSETNGEWKIYV